MQRAGTMNMKDFSAHGFGDSAGSTASVKLKPTWINVSLKRQSKEARL